MSLSVVLLSAGLHPVSGRGCPVPVELQAIGLARGLGGNVVGLHAASGPDADWQRGWGGYGLDRLLRVGPVRDDPLPALLQAIRRLGSGHQGTVHVLAGRRGQGGEDSGMLPYRLAHALGRPLVADVVLANRQPGGGLEAVQWRPHAARRAVQVAGPVVMTVHPAAPGPPAFVFDQARRAVVEDSPVDPVPGEAAPVDERPHRRRPPVQDRPAGAQGTRVLTDLDATAAARIVLDHLRSLGLCQGPAPAPAPAPAPER